MAPQAGAVAKVADSVRFRRAAVARPRPGGFHSHGRRRIDESSWGAAGPSEQLIGALKVRSIQGPRDVDVARARFVLASRWIRSIFNGIALQVLHNRRDQYPFGRYERHHRHLP
jgi:hypothetical protein